MDHAEIKDLAIAALAGFREAALADPITYARRDGPREVEEAIATIRARMEPAGATNPHFAPAHESASALVALAATDPDGYAAFLAPVFEAYRHPGAEPGSRGGLIVLATFLQAVGDDHDWAVDTAGDAPVVRPQTDLPTHAPTLTPRALRDVTLPLLDAAASLPRP